MSASIHMTLMSFNMNRPLNRAHAYERQAEEKLQSQQWEEAKQWYSKAAEMMRVAIAEVSTTSIAVSLRHQLEKLEQMTDVINFKQKEAAKNGINRKESTISLQSKKQVESCVELQNQTAKTPLKDKDRAEQSLRQASSTSGKSTGQVTETPSIFQVLQDNITSMVQDRETDTLLQFLNLSNDEERHDITASWWKKPKSQAEIIEQYKTRVGLLEKTALALVKALEEKDCENRSLQCQVQELKNENDDLMARLEVYAGNDCYTGLRYMQNWSENDVDVPGETMASMLIQQPEDYFKFNQNELELELEDATRDFIRPVEPGVNPSPSLEKHNNDSKFNSVGYEEVVESSSNEALGIVSQPVMSSHSRLTSLAGLPPLSPVHYEIND